MRISGVAERLFASQKRDSEVATYKSASADGETSCLSVALPVPSVCDSFLAEPQGQR
jgi:hypothetical protein